MTDIVLASKSPRRRELFSLITQYYTAVEPDINENRFIGLRAKQQTLKLAEEKCEKTAPEYPESTVIGCDTLVEFRKRVYGKPKDSDDAYRMLKELSGNTHNVYTGVCIKTDGKTVKFVCRTKVKFNKLEETEIRSYVHSKDPLDKAGAYGVQSGAARYIKWIKGDYYNVMGLPVSAVYGVLKKCGKI